MHRIVYVLGQIQVPLDERLMHDTLKHLIVSGYVLTSNSQIACINAVLERVRVFQYWFISLKCAPVLLAPSILDHHVEIRYVNVVGEGTCDIEVLIPFV